MDGTIRRRLARALTLAALGAAPSVGFAVDYTWNNSSGGSFATGANWTPASPAGGPGAADRAVFNLNSTYTVTFPATVSNSAFRETIGNVTLDIGNGRTYTVSSANGFELGTTATQTANLNVTSGALILGLNNTGIGMVTNSTGNLVITGAGASFTANAFCDIGVNGTGSVTIQNGASASIAGSSYIGAQSSGDGTLRVQGTGTTASLGTNFAVGQGGHGILAIDSGATATIGSGLIVGNNPGSSGIFSAGNIGNNTTTNTSGITLGFNSSASGSMNIFGGNNTLNNVGDVIIARVAGSTGTVNISNFNTWNQSGGSIYIGGNSAGAGGNGTFNFLAGTLTVTGAGNGITIRGTSAASLGTLNITGGVISTPKLIRDPNGAFNFTGGTLNINGGMLNLNTTYYDVSGSGVTLNFNGPGSVFGNSSVGLRVGRSAGQGTFNVLGGAQPVVDSFAVAIEPNSNGTLNIIGPGSTLTANGATLGASGSSGTMTIQAGGKYTGTGRLFIGSGGSGTLDVTGAGSWAALGDDFVLGSGGNGTMFVENGGFASGASIFIGDSGGTGNLLVTGTGSQLSLGNTIYLASGGSSHGSMSITSGGGALGSQMQVGTGSGAIGDLKVTGAGSSLSVPSGVILIGNGASASTATFSAGATVTASGLQINTASTVNLNGATLNTGSISLNGGVFNFNAGTINFTGNWTADFSQVNSILGSAATLGPGHTINVASAVVLQSPLTLAGGTLRAGSISGTSNLLLNLGTFELTNSSLSISPSGPIGGNVTIGPALALKITGASSSLDITASSTLYIPGGNVTATTANISGRVQLASPVAQLNGVVLVNSGGVIQGTGQVNGFSIINFGGAARALAGDYLVFNGPSTVHGTVDLQGGTVEFREPLSIGGSGMISGRGAINAATLMPGVSGAITNNGTLQFSGGFTDIRGTLTSTAGSKIIVTGGGTATFYNNVSLAAGSSFQVSANSNAVFFGNVTGSNNFTGSGTKYFEAGSSPLGPVQSPGSTVVEAPASVSASYFREDSLTVNGKASINSSGGTSHLNALNIDPDGVLDLKNNSLVLEGGDLQAITSLIRSGLNQGKGIVSSAPGSSFRLGSMSNAGTIYSSFQGIGGLDGNEVLVRYTMIGDLNLDGTVSISDFIDLAAHFNTATGATWQIGDVNYDGAVTIADFIDLASNFNQSISGQVSPISAEEAAMLADFGASVGATLVPEPSIPLSLLAGALLLKRRKRKLR